MRVIILDVVAGETRRDSSTSGWWRVGVECFDDTVKSLVSEVGKFFGILESPFVIFRIDDSNDYLKPVVIVDDTETGACVRSPSGFEALETFFLEEEVSVFPSHGSFYSLPVGDLASMLDCVSDFFDERILFDGYADKTAEFLNGGFIRLVWESVRIREIRVSETNLVGEFIHEFNEVVDIILGGHF